MSNDSISLSIINALPEHIAVIDNKGIITHTNQAWKKFSAENSGNPSKTGVGINYLDVCCSVKGEERGLAQEAYTGIQQVLEGKIHIFTLEYPCHSDEEKRWFLMNVTALPKASGGVVMSHINITERKIIEESRRVAEIGYWEWESDKKSIFLSSEARTILGIGHQKKNPEFTEFMEIIHPHDREKLHNLLLAATESKSEFQYDFRINSENDELQCIHLRAESISVINTGHYKIIGTVIDNTDVKRAENEIKHNEEQLRLITDSVPALIAYIGNDGRYKYVNGVYKSWYGLDNKEICGCHMSEVMGMEEYAKARKKVEAALSGFHISYKTEIRLKNNVKKSISVALVPFYGADRNIIGLISVIQDISYQKESTELIRLHTEILENMTEGVHLVGKDGILIYTNPALNRMFGYKAGELLYKHVSILNASINASKEEVAEKILHDLEHEGSWEGEVLNQKKDGTLMWCYAKITSFNHSEYGDVWLTVQDDISEKKINEELIKNNQEQLRLITDSLPALIASLDSNLRVTYINKRYQEWFKVKNANYVGSRASKLVPRSIYKQHEGYLLQALSGEYVTYEGTIPKDDDSTRHLNIKIIPHKVDKDIIGIYVLANDVTEIKNQEIKRLKQAVEHRDELVKEVHHRIKNNLQAVSGLLRRHINLRSEIKPYIEEAISQVNTIAIIHGLKSTNKNEDISLTGLLESIIIACGRLTQVKIEFKPECNTDISIADIESVPIALVINELLINAIKHSKGYSQSEVIHVNLSTDESSAKIGIRNFGSLSEKEFSFKDNRGLGMGLKLVKSLLPVSGVVVNVSMLENEVVANMELIPPAINITLREELAPAN